MDVEIWAPPVPLSYGIERSAVSGRALRPWYLKVNPIWWFGNDGEPDPPTWYLPSTSKPLRYVYWYLRNPLVNFSNYIVGVCDRNYSVHGMAPIRLTAWNDLAPDPKTGWRTGFKWTVIDTRVPLPFVSYVGHRVMWYAGWQVSGNLGFKFNLIRNPPNG